MATPGFDGVPIVELLADGRTVKLKEPFGFHDARGVRWPVPAGTVVDGASIPRPLWALIGGPFEGRYRNASIVHDHYCDRRNRPWQQVHRVFYDAMIASSVAVAQAKLLYFAVASFGPRWPAAGAVAATPVAPPPYDPAAVAAAAAIIRDRDPGPDEIARLAAHPSAISSKP